MIAASLTARLKDVSLVTDKALVAGKWLDKADSGKTFEVTNPSTGEVIAVLPDMGRDETSRAIDAAYTAQKAWAKKTGKERAGALRKLFDLMVANADDLATILTTEMGKPWAEARGEILYGASYVEWFGEEAKRVYGDLFGGAQADKRIIVIRQPVGVVGAITPWNFPLNLVAHKIAPAIASGNPIVLKPPSKDPLVRLTGAEIIEEAGAPAGSVSVLPMTRELGDRMVADERFKLLSFTGSPSKAFSMSSG